MIYAFSNSDSESLRNLHFFIKHGMWEGDGCHYVIIVQDVMLHYNLLLQYAFLTHLPQAVESLETCHERSAGSQCSLRKRFCLTCGMPGFLRVGEANIQWNGRAQLKGLRLCQSCPQMPEWCGMKETASSGVLSIGFARVVFWTSTSSSTSFFSALS